MNFLKIGSSPVVEIPLAVTFTNMHLNQCYQILPGSKVITAFDTNWSNVVDVDNITDRLSDIYAEIKDLLVSDPSNTAALQAKVAELNSIKADLTNSGFRPAYITEQTTAVNGAIASVSCYVTVPGARSANTCTADDVNTNIESAANAGDCKNPYKGNCEVFDSNVRVNDESNSNGKYVVIKSPSLVCQSGYKYELFSEYYASNLTRSLVPDSWAPLINALKHYGGVVGVPSSIVYSILPSSNPESIAFTTGDHLKKKASTINIAKNTLINNKEFWNVSYNFILAVNHENMHVKHFLEGIDDHDITRNHTLAIAEGLENLYLNPQLKSLSILQKSTMIWNELQQICNYLTPYNYDIPQLERYNKLIKYTGYELSPAYNG